MAGANCVFPVMLRLIVRQHILGGIKRKLVI